MIDTVDHKTLFEAMPVPRILLREIDGVMTVISVNNKAVEFFAKERHNLENRPLSRLIDPENLKLLEEACRRARHRQESTEIQTTPTLPGEMNVPGFWINPVKDKEGQTFFDVIAQPPSFSDTALQRERDDALLLLTSIFDTSEVGIIVTDSNRRIVKVNDSFIRIFGWERDDLVGYDFTKVVDQSDKEWAEKNHERFIVEGVRSTGEMKVLRKNGHVANTLLTTATIELSHRRRFQVTTLMDISLRKQMEMSLRYAKEQADTANLAKSSFLANMSHELRTPLNAIIGFSEMMMNETFGPLGHDKYKEYLGDVHLSARHLLEIINEVLDMSKIEAGRVELDEKDIDIKALTQSVTRIMASRAFSSGLTIKEEIEDNLPSLHADPRLVRQILINLVTNAVKFSEKGTITVKAFTSENGGMDIIVEDEGIGIPAEKIEDALEPFGQIKNPMEGKGFQGTGLGLPLAKAMTELHNGLLFLKSKEGQGTTVTISMPPERVKPRTQKKIILDTDTNIAGSDLSDFKEQKPANQ